MAGDRSSVIDNWLRFDAGVNSLTVAVTRRREPTETPGAMPVNTKMPSEVAGSASAASTDCRKNPLLNLIPVTTPSVSTNSPSCGLTAPLPWIWLMVRATATGGATTASMARARPENQKCSSSAARSAS